MTKNKNYGTNQPSDTYPHSSSRSCPFSVIGKRRRIYRFTTLEVTLSPTAAPTLIPYPVKGLFVLKEQTGVQSVKEGEPFVIDVIATSGTDTVAGYDAIFSYDETAFARQSVQNKLDTFRIFTYDKDTHVSISATKNLQETDPVRFANTPILSLTFIGKKQGTFVFSLKSVGNESSKLVNESAQVTYPETSDFRLEIN